MPGEWHFLRPGWLLMLLPLLVLVWRLSRSVGGGNAWRGLVDPHLLSHLLVDAGKRPRLRAAWLLGFGWLLLVLALAGPSWQRLPQPGYQLQQYRVILLDLSPSMNAADRSPSRLAFARFKVLDLLRRSRSGQVALIAYGPEPFLVSPLTSDVETIVEQVPKLETELLPVAGERRVGMALDEAVGLLQRAGAPFGDVIMVTDALPDAAMAEGAARRLAGAGYRLSVLGVGTPDGARVPLAEGGFVTDSSGAALLARLEEDPLRMLATVGGGTYVTASAGERDLDALLARSKRSSSLPGTAEDDLTTDQWREEGPWLLLLLLPLAALAFRRGCLGLLSVIVLIAPLPPAHAFTWDDFWLRPDQRAMQALNEGRPAEAAPQFTRTEWRAAAHYQAGQFTQALENLQGIVGTQADYNRGNTLARLWRLEDALAAYERVLAVDPGNADARHNRDLVRDLLERQHSDSQVEDDASMSMQGQGEPDEEGSSPDDSASQDGASSQQDDASTEDGQSGPEQQSQAGQQAGNAQQEGAGQQAQPNAEPGQEGTAGSEQPSNTQAGAQGDAGQQQEAANQDAPGEQQRPEEGLNQPGERARSGREKGLDQQAPSDLPGWREPDMAEAGNPFGEPGERTGSLTDFARNDPEGTRVMEQMLRTVPDDPAGLLRQRFLLQHQRRRGQLPQADLWKGYQ